MNIGSSSDFNIECQIIYFCKYHNVYNFVVVDAIIINGAIFVCSFYTLDSVQTSTLYKTMYDTDCELLPVGSSTYRHVREARNGMNAGVFVSPDQPLVEVHVGNNIIETFLL